MEEALFRDSQLIAGTKYRLVNCSTVFPNSTAFHYFVSRIY